METQSPNGFLVTSENVFSSMVKSWCDILNKEGLKPELKTL